MSHRITPYHRFLFESSSVKMQGFYLAFSDVSTYAHLGVAATFNDFAQEVCNSILGENNWSFIPDEFALLDILHENGYFEHTEMSETPDLWTGFTPKSQTPSYDSVWVFDPYEVIERLETVFVNPKSIIRKPRGSKDYIVNSIINSPDDLPHYVDRPYFEEDVLPQLLKIPDPDLQALLKYHRLKIFL